jgi:tetratricopeptide (TPR) repeat protein
MPNAAIIFPSARILLFALVAVAAILAACGQASDPDEMPEPDTAAIDVEFIGGAACADCHAEQAHSWSASHHDQAMMLADDASVLGNFEDAALEYNGVLTEFFRRDDEYWVRTDGADGALTEYQVTHTFGVAPLQQYMVETGNGHIQVLTSSWDSRPAAEGGQRWFHLYPDENIDSDDPLHWTGEYMNWNSVCASCHSTNLEKNYTALDGSYATTFSSIDVDCESCHGPGSLHAKAPEAESLQLAREDAEWVFAPGASIAHRVPARTSQAEIETCAQCHSRRGQFKDKLTPGAPLLDAFRPALLDQDLYYADGQILDEVYVYGSFLQSRMHQAGVSCSDCHNPHSVELKFDGNAVCGQCHVASNYETRDHHRHTQGQAGSNCVDCHMPAKTYMVVDPRRDHSFRVPRPDLSDALQSPNACVGCHSEQSNAWAAATVKEWYPDGRSGTAHYGAAIAAGRNWSLDRGPRLIALVNDASAPAIVRATAVSLLSAQLNEAAYEAVLTALQSDETLMQLAALDALGAVPVEARAPLAQDFLDHPVQALRMAAARQLLSARQHIRQSRQSELAAAVNELRNAQLFNIDRSEGLINLSGMLAESGALAEAEELLQRAIAREPYLVTAHVNLADLYRASGRESEAIAVLERATRDNPDDPAGHFALGLAMVRSGETDTARGYFRRAYDLAPGEPYYAYIMGVALNNEDTEAEALELLAEAHKRFPGYREITFALATMHRSAGNRAEALRYTEQLLQLSPTDSAAMVLKMELEATQ